MKKLILIGFLALAPLSVSYGTSCGEALLTISRPEKPVGFVTRQWRHAVQWLNSRFEAHFGRTVTMESAFRRNISTALTNMRGDASGVSRMIGRYREQYLAALRRSIETDVEYARVSAEIRVILKSGQYDGSESYMVIRRLETLKRDIDSLKETLEQQLKTQEAPETFIARSATMRNKLKEQASLRKRLGSLLRSTKRLKSSEYELVSRWKLLEELGSKSDEYLAALYVKSTSLKVLENMLTGELNGLDVPIRARSLKPLFEVLKKEKHFLARSENGSDSKSPLAWIYERDLDAVQRDPGTLPYGFLKRVGESWQDFWYARMSQIAPQIEFRFAVSNISQAAWRVWLTLGPEALKRRVVEVAGTLKSLWKRAFDAKVDSILGKQAAAVAKMELSSERTLTSEELSSYFNLKNPSDVAQVREIGADVIRAAMAFVKIVEMIRVESPTPEQLQDLRNNFSLLRNYIDQQHQRGQALDENIAAILASSQGMEIRNWVAKMSESPQNSGVPFDLIVAETILHEQVQRATQHHAYTSELMAQILVWSGSTYLGYQGIQMLVNMF